MFRPPWCRNWLTLSHRPSFALGSTGHPPGSGSNPPTFRYPPIWLGLGDGEASAIQLARDLQADFVIVDERAGRRAAQLHRVPVLGTLAVLERAATLDGTLDLHTVVRELQRLGFRVSPAVLRLILPGLA